MNDINWKLLTDHIDYHHRQWYELDAGVWLRITRRRALDLIRQLEPMADPEEIAKQFAYRDQDAHGRSESIKANVKRKFRPQMMLGL